MKLKLENDDIASIASMVVDCLQPLLSPVPGNNTADTIMDVKDLAAYLKVKPTWVYKQLEYKTIPHFHAGRYPRFLRKEIDAWIRSQYVPATPTESPRLPHIGYKKSNQFPGSQHKWSM